MGWNGTRYPCLMLMEKTVQTVMTERIRVVVALEKTAQTDIDF